MEEWKRDMARAVPDSLLRDIVNDHRRGVSERSSLASRPQSSEPPATKGNGWQDAVPIGQPPGVDLIDRMVEAQSHAERIAAIRQKVENEWFETHVRRDPYRAVTEYNPFDKKRLGHDDDE